MLLAAAAAIATAGAAREAGAFEFFDGRLEVHGFYEAQIRGVARNFDGGDDWDVTQFYHVLNVEIDFDIAPDGFGPFDLVSSFVRLEARYDCVWTNVCHVFPSANAFGDGAKKLPNRLIDAERTGYDAGAVFTGDTRRIAGIPVDQLDFAFKDLPHNDQQAPAYLWHFPGVSTLFGVPGSDGRVGTLDDPAFSTFARFVQPGDEFRFGLRKIRGPIDGQDLQPLGPWLPRNRIDPVGTLADRPNPFSPLDFNPIAGTRGSFGSTAMPYRPAPLLPAAQNPPTRALRADARGLFVPNRRFAEMLQDDAFDSFDQNFSEEELAWNHGASQDERELKEAYLDLELFDSRLWIRAGKQNIVWGKTELFRTTDQFNPQDLALASLPNLEESRIALWSVRGVWSFFEVGPLEDFRIELAANLDKVEPTDLGRCGEPYSPNPVCNKSAGLFAHGIAGFGLGGEVRPPPWWNDPKGLEVGARVEFRWDRFSFALTNFYGYEDFPYVDAIFFYSRNVDPRTGRPRRGQSQAGCDPEGRFDGDTSGCLAPGEDALRNHHANQQRFAVICSASVGFNDLDPTVCAQSVLNSNRSVLTGAPDSPPTISESLGGIIAGNPAGLNLAQSPAFAGTRLPNVEINRGPLDGPGQGLLAGTGATLGSGLSDEQEALLGCGAFWGTSCDVSTSSGFGGIDLLNAELGVVIQSWIGVPGTSAPWDTRVGQQPGTIRETAPGLFAAFQGAPAGRRWENGTTYTLPGARSPFSAAADLDPASWSAAIDGCVRPSDPGCAGQRELRHPYTGDLFVTELATVSFNFMMTFVALSGLGKPFVPCGPNDTDTANCRLINEFLADDPRTPIDETVDPSRCSFAAPQLCSNIQAIYAVAHTTPRRVRAGGNGSYGRLDFDWHVGGTGVLRYEKRNVLGFSTDFAEDATKSNWSLEATWIEGLPFDDSDSFDGLRSVDTYNLTVSVDRPTFINFLNPNRTFFINSQWFFQYARGFRRSMPSNGPFNVLTTLRVETGYFRDRLQPGFTVVYDFNSQSGALLPEISYRFTEDLSATIAASWFWGRFEPALPPLRTVGDPPYRVGQSANDDFIEEGLSPIRDRDELALFIRYTF